MTREKVVGFVLYPLEIPDKTNLDPQKLHKFVTHQRKILRPKTKSPLFLPRNKPPLFISSIPLEVLYPHLNHSYLFACSATCLHVHDYLGIVDIIFHA